MIYRMPPTVSSSKNLYFEVRYHKFLKANTMIRQRLAILSILATINILGSPTVIWAHLHPDFRCTHVPPTPERVNHVWLDNANFTPNPDEDRSLESHAPQGFTILDDNVGFYDDGPSIQTRIQQRQAMTRSRRYINPKIAHPNAHSRSLVDTPIGESGPMASNLNSFWDRLWKRLGNRDDLVPMRIQVYYDSSVYQLDKKRLKSINETVMPSVVQFFEDVLLIRREYTIDRFRISRRCPNNTIYYAKDVVGRSRPYCMERCEDHAVCGEMIVPKEHLSACSYCNPTSRRCTTNLASEGKGVANTQLLLYVSAKQTARCKKDQTIAYAAHCAQDTKTDRPVAGHANLCPNSISTDPKDLKALIATVKHELTHVLGFSVSLFAYYRDSNGQPLTERESVPGPIPVDPRTGYAKWSDRVIKRVVRTNWTTGEGAIDKEVHMMVTPTVVREVRKHFNCSTLEGAELEDQGSDGTSMTHWEKRLFENEAMTGTHTQNSVYSRITLAVLQDTGWYVANFTSAERLEWGKDLGCEFAKKSCKSWIDERRAKQLSIRPFCDRVKGDLLQIACTEDRSSKAVCNMRHYKDPLPGVYQNFDRLEGTDDNTSLAHFGGSVDLADYCPFIQEFTWQVQNITVRGSRCDLGSNSIESEKNAALEHYGPESRCFEHGRRWEQRSCVYKRHWHHFGAGCYKYTCSGGHINVIVGDISYPCYYTDQVVHIEQLVDRWLYNGSVVCPSCDKVCSPTKCMTYDKRLIDQLIEMSNHLDLMKDVSSSDEMLRVILDEYHNGIDTQSVPNSRKSFAKYRSVLEEMSKLTTASFKAMLIPDETTSYIFAFPSRKDLPDRHSLVCSASPSSTKRPPTATNLILLMTILFHITHLLIVAK